MYYLLALLFSVVPFCLEARKRYPFTLEQLTTGEVVSQALSHNLPSKLADTYDSLKLYPNLEIWNKAGQDVTITANGKTHSLPSRSRLIQSISTTPLKITIRQGSIIKAYTVDKKFFFGEIVEPPMRLEPQKLVWHYTLTNLRLGYYTTESGMPIIDLKEVAQKKDIDAIPTYYELLGVSSDASYNEIEKKACEMLKNAWVSSKPELLEAFRYAGTVALARNDTSILSVYLDFLGLDQKSLNSLSKNVLYEKYKESLKSVNKDLNLDQNVERFNSINEAYKLVSLYLYSRTMDSMKKITSTVDL